MRRKDTGRTRAMRESEIEKYFVACVKKLGGYAEKFSSPSRRSVPDRLVTFPRGRVSFVELKATGKKPTKAQERDHKRRRKMGFRVFVVDNNEDAYILAEVLAGNG